MKKITFLLILTLITAQSFGQSEKASCKTVADRFEKNYNAENYEAIFSDFSPEMKNALPLDKTIDFLNGLNLQSGKITNQEFMKYEDTYASYKTTFERTVFSILISLDNNSKINGLYVKPFIEDNYPKPERNTTKLSLPFKDEWTVIWGGDTKELNYHVGNQAQKNAFDMVITDESGKSYKTDGQMNDDYYAFGKELYTPCDGKVVLVVDGVKDNKSGKLNPIYIPGNTVIIKTVNNEYLFFAHFKQNSIEVKEGQTVKQGELLGLCGNSGNSSEPHLHFHVQNIEDMNDATGIKCYFDKLIVDGEHKSDYSPIKNNKVKPE